MVDRDVVLRPELRVLDTFSGYGGFELGLKLAGVNSRTVARVEWEAHAAATLVKRMEDKALDPAVVWSDIQSFDGVPWRGRVDLLTGGFNCQPWSAAGQKRGTDDDRWLWPHIARIIAEVGPWLVFLENVPGLNRGADGGGLSFVLQDLADLGFDAEWGLLSAADVGASQRRERLWLLAVAHGHLNRLQAVWGERLFNRIGTTFRDDTDGPGRAAVGDAGGARRPEVTGGTSGDEGPDGWRTQGAHVADGAVQDVADAESVDEREPHDVERSVARQRPWPYSGWRGFPPRPDDADGWERWIAAGGPEPSLRRELDGSTGRLVKPAGIADRLHLLGNGLVPLAAAHAFRQLSVRFLEDSDDRLV